MIDIGRILCPIDLSDVSRHALEHARAFAKWYGARLSGLYVCEPGPPPIPDALVWPFNQAAPTPEQRTALCQQVTALMKPASEDLSTDVHVEVGYAADTIVDRAQSWSVDLIVMGTHGHGGFQHLILGSVAEKVLRKARCPVLTVPPRASATSKLPFRRLLCPIDFSDASLAALAFAFSLAQESDSALTIMHVLEDPIVDDEMIGADRDWTRLFRDRERSAENKLRALVPATVKDWCSPATRVTRGKPYREILGVATEAEADLIVIGVHGRNALDLMLLGSTTNQVVRRATCPVLTVRRT